METIAEDAEAEYELDKVKKKYGSLGHPVLLVQLERGSHGLGLSLAGHKDRSRMAVFVVGLNPAGAAFKTGAIHVGDEILEVNGVVLQGRCHLNASAIIKGLPGPVFKVILLRREAALDELAVKPITQFPVSLDDETPEERYANFKGLRTVTIKKAGLIVGDMILAVNKDTLLGSDYDSAASLLKKTEGVVTLVVCNPNKAKEEEKGEGEGKGGQSPNAAAGQPKEPEKPRLLPKPFLQSLKPQKSSPLKTNLSPILPSAAGLSVMETLSPGMGPSKSLGTPGTTRTTSAASTPAHVSPSVSPSSTLRLSPSPSGKIVTTPEEPPADPATCEISAGKETTIEINKDKMGLGLSIVGGSDTLLSVIIIHEVYPDGAAAKDGRLKPGDQILEVNSEDFRNITHSKALAALRQTPAKVKMIVYRDEASSKEEDIFDIMEVELTKKPGKGLGLSIVGRKNGHGVFISDVVHGGTAEACGKLMKGDQILTVNGQDLKNASQEEAAAVLKTATGKVTMKLGRLKAGSRRSSSGNTDRK